MHEDGNIISTDTLSSPDAINTALAGDVTLTYLNAPCREKIWFEGQVENGDERGKVLIVTRAFYGLKSSGAAWRAEFAGTLRDMGFTSSKADPDV